jgi:molybdopterin/thiamine biosynthesis adenylyltransferase
VKGVKITPHNCKIQEFDEDFYLQFQIVVCGLDSIEARRWINATLVNMVDPDVGDSLVPLIDGGTEGMPYSDAEPPAWTNKPLQASKGNPESSCQP